MHDLDELAICGESPRLRGWLPAGPYRQHLRRLITDSGLPWRAIALYAGVPVRFVRRLAGARPPRRVPMAVAQRLWAVTEADLAALAGTPGRRRVTARRVRWLLDRGVPPDRIAAMVGVSTGDVERLGRDRGWCSARTELLARAAVQAHAARHPWLEAPVEAAA
ncbi:MAG: hypothetical protein GXX86_12645 [Propionibacterium sp.]|nr:hypothetical protein [Propionibacterium sp.]